MLSSIKKIFIFLVIITVLVIGIIFAYSFNRTYFNDEDETGNTTGNIYNGGLFCEKDGKIYFSNDSDGGSLYVMNSDCTKVKKLYQDKAVYINADGNYIYYVRANNTRENKSGSLLNFNNTGIYRINQNGRYLKAITDDPGSYLTLKGNFVYYQSYKASDGLYLYRKKIDLTNERLLLKEAVIPSVILDNKLYYCGVNSDHNIDTLDLGSFLVKPYIAGNISYPIFTGEYIYYIDEANNYTLNRMKTDGSEPAVIVDKRCSTYNITNSGTYIYYQVDDSADSKICRINLKTLESETVKEGNYKQINVTKNYVFFKDFKDAETFIMSADDTVNVKTFKP